VQYRVSNNAQITIREIDSVGAVLDAAIDAGANSVWGVNFRLDDPDRVQSQAQEAAIADAQAKAESLASLTGSSVGRVISISEIIGGGGGVYGSNFAAQERGLGGGGAGPISPGELELTMQLQVVYELSD
jgi:uncharacterized protein YggE